MRVSASVGRSAAVSVGVAGLFLLGSFPFPPLHAAAVAPPTADTVSSETHVYYVAAERVTWDYAPSGRDMLTGARFDTTSARLPGVPRDSVYRYYNMTREDYIAGRELDAIGHVYEKVLYRQYTDSTFTERKERPPKWEHLGFLGPVLRAEVGDTIKVVFRNKADRPYSMHPHGVSYEKDSEGKAYLDGTSEEAKADDAVPPGETHTYVWPVPKRAGPGPRQPSSVLWMYHSHVHENEDINTGLVGPLIVTRQGMAGPDGEPKDVDREFITMYESVQESQSWLYTENIRNYTDLSVDTATNQPGFGLTNDMHSINGWSFANMPTMTMRVGENVRWYILSGTVFIDMHTAHWHGNTTVLRGRRTDMVDIGPMMMAVADMKPDNPGTWLYHCHVNFHFTGGMSALYRVLPEKGYAEEAKGTGSGFR